MTIMQAAAAAPLLKFPTVSACVCVFASFTFSFLVFFWLGLEYCLPSKNDK